MLEKIRLDSKKEWIISIFKDHKPKKFDRIRLGRFLFKVGYTRNEILDLIAENNKWYDYNPKITKINVDHLIQSYDPKKESGEYYHKEKENKEIGNIVSAPKSRRDFVPSLPLPLKGDLYLKHEFGYDTSQVPCLVEYLRVTKDTYQDIEKDYALRCYLSKKRNWGGG